MSSSKQPQLSDDDAQLQQLYDELFDDMNVVHDALVQTKEEATEALREDEKQQLNKTLQHLVDIDS